MTKGPNLAESAPWDNIRNAFWHYVLREFGPMSPNPAPFVVWLVSICYIATCNPQHPVANVIVDGSSPFTRSLTTADSNCQPLFILRRRRGLGRLGVVWGEWFYCQLLTANACLGLTFGTISGTGVVFLAPNSALESSISDSNGCKHPQPSAMTKQFLCFTSLSHQIISRFM